MDRYFHAVAIILVVLLCLATTAMANFTYVPIIQSTSSPTDACTFNGNVTSGDILFIAEQWSTANGSIAISDSVSTSFTQNVIQSTPGGSSPYAVIYTGLAGGSGADTITLAVTGSTFPRVICAELPPLWTLTVDGTPTVKTTSGTTATSTAITTTLNDDLLFTMIGFNQFNSDAASVRSPDYQLADYYNGVRQSQRDSN